MCKLTRGQGTELLRRAPANPSVIADKNGLVPLRLNIRESRVSRPVDLSSCCLRPEGVAIRRELEEECMGSVESDPVTLVPKNDRENLYAKR